MTERIAYTLVRRMDQVEIRRYPRIVLATVVERPDDEAFGILFDYISGSNKLRRRLPMTAPVISGKGPNERIPMTVPVVSTANSFSFVLPEGYTAEDAPQPSDPRVVIQEIPERTVGVLVFRGRTNDEQVRKRSSALIRTLQASGVEVKGEPFLMRYNPPFIPGVFRHNEIGVQVRLSEK